MCFWGFSFVWFFYLLFPLLCLCMYVCICVVLLSATLSMPHFLYFSHHVAPPPPPTSSPITTPSLIIILPVENPHPLHLTAFVFLPSIAVKPEVIDYGHGAKTDDPIADLDREADRFERDRASRLDRPKWDDSRHLKSQ